MAIISESVSQSLTLIEGIAELIAINVNIQNDAGFNVVVDGANLRQEAQNDLGLDVEVLGVALHGFGAVGAGFGVVVDAWNLHQYIQNDIVFDRAVVEDIPPIFELANEVGFGNAVVRAASVFNINITTALQFGSVAQKTETASITSAIEFETHPAHNARVAVGFTNAVVGEQSYVANNLIGFNVSVILGLDITRSQQTDLGFANRLVGYIADVNLNVYRPISIGSAVGCLVKPPASIISGQSDSTILSFGERTLILRNPEFNNTEALDSKKIFRRNRAHEPIVYRDCDWALDETHKMSFIALKRQEVEELLTFLRASIGQRVQLFTYEGRRFFGIIMNPDTAVSFVRTDWYNVSLEIIVEEGEFSVYGDANTSVGLNNQVTGVL